MVAIRLASAIAAASMLLSVSANTTPSATVSNHIETPTVTLPASAIAEVGCFETDVPLENHGEYLFQSPGNCQLICIEQGKAVMGLSDGENCWCGDLIPPEHSQTRNSSCDTTCSGDRTVKCGGPNLLWVALTGTTRNKVGNYVPDDSSSSLSASKTATETSSSATSTKTAAPTSSADDSKPNTVAIAVGVVVGVVSLAGILFGVWFLLRKRRQRQAEEDYRRDAANVSSFVNGGKLHTSNSSMNDSRLDPSFMDRRQSNGSIADNEDYSRRILKVTNV